MKEPNLFSLEIAGVLRIFIHIPLVRTCSHGPTQLQGKPGNDICPTVSPGRWIKEV